ncbi:MAG TPA: ABC transporter substrate-binding protein [Stellaceae bacterium]|jgi:4,5-dihydroxyphthalate decarboxylase
MADVRLSFACGLYDRVLPLYRGMVKPEGVDLDFQAIDDPRQVFDRMAKGDFDISEMSSSEHATRIANGNRDFVAIPVFVSRIFRHSFIFHNRHRGIAAPKDLAGKRIGISAYGQTAAVFIRGLLQHEYGVDLSSVHWVLGTMNGSGGHLQIPKLSISINIEQDKSGKSLSELLAAGEIDATLGALVPDSFGRHPDVQRLFPDFRAAEKSYYRKTGIFPIMHLIALRREVHDRHPFVAASLYAALNRSKELAAERMREVGALAYMLPWLPDYIRETDEVFGKDPWPYGVEPNRPTLEALVTYLAEQGMVPAAPSIESLFVPNVGVR